MPQARTHWYYTSLDGGLWRFPIPINTTHPFNDGQYWWREGWSSSVYAISKFESYERLTKAEARYRFPLAFKK